MLFKMVVEWSGLPKELLETIGESLDSRLDVLRSRSVCSSWRSSIPPFHARSPRFPLRFPPPYIAPPVYLCESTLYLLQPLNPFPTSTSSSCNKGWLIKVEDSNSGKLRLLDPLSNRYIGYFPLDYAKTLNLASFRITELSKAYTLRDEIVIGPTSNNERKCVPSYRFACGVKKALMIPNSARTSADGCVVFAIFHIGKLAFAKFGDEEWTTVDDWIPFLYNDISVYNGQLHVVDRSGIVSRIEYPPSNLVQCSHPLTCTASGSQKHLVESCGALYLVDRFEYDGRLRYCFKVYKLDAEQGQWDSVRSLGDRAFVLGTSSSFSVSAQEIFGYKRNCIYFTDEHRSQSCVFNLKDRSIGRLTFFTEHSHPFCPPPTWLSPTNPSSSTC
ncbi:hypothetical protein FH972_007042 [Carpinus fangiana]|uniref:KIB1-4 beta-propeller domain-containing protein n=1 Tax=Carpinus fangiana TaxID=176857 RepID=A0A5N6QUC9_9ROSI|nr:hypothetical protein FH972_007042 [Carpinus fangiana]